MKRGKGRKGKIVTIIENEIKKGAKFLERHLLCLLLFP